MKTLLLATLATNLAYANYIVKKTTFNKIETIESVREVEFNISKIKTLKSIRESISEETKTKNILFEEIAYPKGSLPEKYKVYIRNQKTKQLWPGSEVQEIVKTGRNSNRIVITILGDGYTLAEKERYFSDVKRMVKDMFQEVTFKSYLELFNIYAVFTPSEESGITDMITKQTVFDLYRSPRGSKRGIMPGNKSAITKALDLIGTHTDYPIIIANDDYYGGLGGRYAITTRSLTSGSMVLRHELGHNFSNVGEEYDGGQVYSGANFSRSSNVPWMHWITGSKVSVNDSKFLTGSYVWQDLGSQDFKINFNFPEKTKFTYDLRLSSVGWENKNEVKVLLDDKELELEGVFTKDRSFFRTKKVPLSSGNHSLKIQDVSRDGNNVLAYANGYAYPNNYDFTPNKIGAFNVFANGGRRRGYRPTHNQCLMRDMRSKVFCPVDQENIWLRFLSRINLIDEVQEKDGQYKLILLKLETISIKWFKKERWSDAEEIVELRGKLSANLKKYGKGKYEVHAELSHPEIRKKSEVTRDIKELRVQ
jgi:hypothetical protein